MKALAPRQYDPREWSDVIHGAEHAPCGCVVTDNGRSIQARMETHRCDDVER